MSSAASTAVDVAVLYALQRAAFSEERYPSHAVRRDRLDRLATLIDRHEPEIVAAIAEDFGVRPPQETRLTELFVVDVALRHASRHLARLDALAARTDAAVPAPRKELDREAAGGGGRHHQPVELPGTARAASGDCRARRGQSRDDQERSRSKWCWPTTW